MYFSCAAFGLLMLLFTPLSFALEYAKPKPVDLSYSCMSVKSDKVNQNLAPILLLHGLAVSKESWEGIDEYLALKTGRRVCKADLRNHGDSPWSDDADIDVNAEDILHLLNMLKMPKAILVGHCLGGKIALHCALKYPERIEKLIVGDMRPNGIPPLAKLQAAVYFKILMKSIKAVPKGATEKQAKQAVADFINDSVAKHGVAPIFNNNTAQALPIKCTSGKCSWKGNTNLLKKISTDMLKYYSQSSGVYNGPSLFLYGTISPFEVWKDEENIKKLFPSATLVEVKGANHFLHESQEFKDAVIKFINEKE